MSTRRTRQGPKESGSPRGPAWGYRLFTKIEFANVLGLQRLAPSLTWIHDVHGNIPITLGTLLEGS